MLQKWDGLQCQIWYKYTKRKESNIRPLEALLQAWAAQNLITSPKFHILSILKISLKCQKLVELSCSETCRRTEGHTVSVSNSLCPKSHCNGSVHKFSQINSTDLPDHTKTTSKQYTPNNIQYPEFKNEIQFYPTDRLLFQNEICDKVELGILYVFDIYIKR